MSTGEKELSGSGVAARPARHIRRLVEHNAADTHLLTLIVAYAITVIVIRSYLELSGYPQIGDSTFHIAHLLWGGLFMFSALVLLLVWANPWLMGVTAALGGIGAGLFIDEVGKFITQKNDYFFPLAFPIIYAVAVVGVWFYFRVRRARPRDARTLLYQSFHYLKKVLDDDLDPIEHDRLLETLRLAAASARDPAEHELAQALLHYVESQDIAVEPLDWHERALIALRAWFSRYPPRRVLKTLLLGALVLVSLLAALKLIGLVTIVAVSEFDIRSAFSSYVIVSGKSRYVVNHVSLLLLQALFIFATGALALAGAFLTTLGHERLGLRLGVLGLVLSLTIVNLVTFYFNQLYAMADALVQLCALGLTQLYRWRFMPIQSGRSVLPSLSTGEPRADKTLS